MKKTLYLFLALLLPALLFVFLKYAGKNEFNIPTYYEHGVENAPAECMIGHDAPYKVPDSIWRRLGIEQRRANVFVFPGKGSDVKRFKSRMADEFVTEDVGIFAPCYQSIDSTQCARLKECIFLISNPWEAVLIDRMGRIRGYYGLKTREEEDRLRVELKILLRQY